MKTGFVRTGDLVLFVVRAPMDALVDLGEVAAIDGRFIPLPHDKLPTHDPLGEPTAGFICPKDAAPKVHDILERYGIGRVEALG